MSRIDRFIQELHGVDGDRLVVAAGQPVTVTVGGSRRTLSASAPSAGQVKELLREILPEGMDPDEEVAGPYEFRYPSPSGPVAVRALVGDSTSRIEVAPADSPPRQPGADAADGDDGGASAPGGSAAQGDAAADEAAEEEESPEGSAAEAVPRARPEEPRPADQDEDGRVGTADAAPGGGTDGPSIERLFRKMVEEGCSDLHVSAGNRPVFRKDGEIVQLGDEPVLSPDETREMLLEITPDRNREEFRERNDTDFGYEIEGLARFRCNLFRDRKGVGGVFRQIPAEIMTAEELGLSDAILELCDLNKGLVVVTGPTGSGKSTTLAAMVDYINRRRKAHIITIEDPIEFVHENKECLINQREVGVHTEGFKVALRAALREDPDIVLVGEMRDLETVEIALETAETGHLVFGTLHTNTAPSTVDRIIDQFPADQQNQIRAMLSESLKGVIAQTLCRRKEGGRVAAMEILLVTSAVSNLIREGKTFQIPSVMQTGSGAGMKTLNAALVELVQEGTVTPREAFRNAVDKEDFRQALQRAGYSLDAEPPGPGG